MINKDFIICGYRPALKADGGIPLNNGYFLFHGADLRIKQITGQKTGNRYLILGYMLQTMPGEETPEVLLEKEDSAIEEILYACGGRWTLITPSRIYAGACGLTALFYGISDAGEQIITNSLAVLRDRFGFKTRTDFQPVKFGVGFDYYPGPATVLRGVKRLMRDQLFDFYEGKYITVQYELIRTVSRPDNELINSLNDSLIEFLRQCSAIFPKVFLPLSGGGDSRAVGSALIRLGVPFTSYTCVKKRMTRSDRTMPRKLSRVYNIPHEYLYPTGDNASREKRFREIDGHTMGLVVDRDREYYANKQYPDGLLLGGGMLACGKDPYKKRVKKIPEAGDKAEAMLVSIEGMSPFMLSLINEYIEYALGAPDNSGMTFSERFYLDQRIGSWLADIEHALDINKAVRLQPLSSAYSLSLFMSVSPSYRSANSNVQREIIAQNAPKWSPFPINKRSSGEKIDLLIKRIVYHFSKK